MSANDNIQALKNAVPSARVVSAYVDLRDEGANLVGRCPFHQDRTPSFKVRKADGKIHCFGCGWDGDQLDFLEKILGISKSEAITRLREMAGQARVPESWDRARQVFKEPVDRQDERRTLGTEEWTLSVKKLWGEEGASAREFLTRRGISEETAKRFLLGLRDGERLFPVGNSDDERARLEPMRQSKWLGIPYIERGCVTAIKWRACSPLPSDCPKIFSAKGMRTDALFNQESIDPLDSLYLTEGEFDAMTLEQAGFRACSLHGAGQKVSPRAKDELFKAEKIFLAGDNEESGIGNRAMERLSKDLGERAHILLWPREGSKKDANDFFLSDCGGNIDDFRRRVIALSAEAAKPKAPHFSAVHEIIAKLKSGGSPLEHADRLRFPWVSIDRMALIIPGDIVAVFASYTGTGKSAFVTQTCQWMAREYGKVSALYTPDLKPERHARMIVSQLARKHRLKLVAEDYDLACSELPAGSIYLGFDPEAQTAGQAIDLCEQAVRRLGADILVLDTLSYIVRNTQRRTRTEETEDVMARLNAMAQKYGIIVFVVVQPRKRPLEPGRAKDRWSEMEDMKYAAAISEDAAAVFNLHRKRLQQPKKETEDVTDSPELDPRTLVRMQKGREMQEGKTAAWLTFRGEMALFGEEEN